MLRRPLHAVVFAALVGCVAAPPVASSPATAAAAPATAPVVPPAPAVDPAAMPRQRATVLRAARYFDGRGDAVVDGGVAILVENG
ncbi:MAG TPA: hypothetical protein VIF15_03590, partial [Polyangiaceae bacterium]